MAAISITASGVLPSAAATIQQGIAGAAITQGQTLYVDTANSNVLKLGDSDASALTATIAGIAITAASTGQKVLYVTKDPAFTLGATILSGDDLWASPTAGGITKTQADLVATNYKVHLGVMTSTTTANINITQGGLIA